MRRNLTPSRKEDEMEEWENMQQAKQEAQNLVQKQYGGIGAATPNTKGNREVLVGWIEDAEELLVGQMTVLREAKKRVKWMSDQDAEVILKLLNMMRR
jgi:hypothetical protein